MQSKNFLQSKYVVMSLLIAIAGICQQLVDLKALGLSPKILAWVSIIGAVCIALYRLFGDDSSTPLTLGGSKNIDEAIKHGDNDYINTTVDRVLNKSDNDKAQSITTDIKTNADNK